MVKGFIAGLVVYLGTLPWYVWVAIAVVVYTVIPAGHGKRVEPEE